jgi:hypothetical protein
MMFNRVTCALKTKKAPKLGAWNENLLVGNDITNQEKVKGDLRLV